MKTPRISPKKIDAWIELMRAQQRLLKAIEEALKDAGLPPLAWYDVLFELEKSGENGLRPMEIERRLLLPQYGTSRLLERLQKAGLVGRTNAPEDGRGYLVALTPKGRELRSKMWPVYAAALQEHFASKLTVSEAQDLHALLAKLRQVQKA